MRGIKAEMPETDSEMRWEPAASFEVLETFEHLMRRFSQDSADGVRLEQKLEEAQDLLEGCVESALNRWLESFKTPITRSLCAQWEFPSDHLPIGAEVGSICVCSWHVQGLSCARTAAPDHESHQQSIFKLVMEMLRHPTCRKHVLCLQGCWQTLREQIDHEFRDTRETFGVLQAGSDVEPDSQQAGASERTCGDVIWVFCFGLLAGVVLQEHQRSTAFQVIIYDTVALELKHFAAEQLLPDERAKARRACSTPATG